MLVEQKQGEDSDYDTDLDESYVSPQKQQQAAEFNAGQEASNTRILKYLTV